MFPATVKVKEEEKISEIRHEILKEDYEILVNDYESLKLRFKDVEDTHRITKLQLEKRISDLEESYKRAETENKARINDLMILNKELVIEKAKEREEFENKINQLEKKLDMKTDDDAELVSDSTSYEDKSLSNEAMEVEHNVENKSSINAIVISDGSEAEDDNLLREMNRKRQRFEYRNQEQPKEQPIQPAKFFFMSTEYAKSTKMQTRCDPFKVVEFLKMKLTAEELRWFTQHDQFKHIFHMVCHRTRKVMGMWMLLLRTARTDKRKQYWFVVNGVPIRYSIREHALLSGFCCHQYPEQHMKMGSLSFVKKYFGGNHRVPKVQVKDVFEALEKMENADNDRLKMAVLYFLCTVIRGRKKMFGGNIEEFILRIIDDLDACETFPWGRFTFDDCMNNISDMMDLMGGMVRETSTFPGFILPLEILAFECISTLKKKFRENLRDAKSDCPRMCKAGFKETSRTGFSLDEIYDALGSTKDICSILAPEGEEKLLVDKLVEDEDDKMDVTDIIVDGWINVLTKPDGKIWWQDLYNSDIQSRLRQRIVLEPIVEKLTSVLKSNSPHGLAQLKEMMPKAVKVVFDVVNKKIDLIDSRLTSMEKIVMDEATIEEDKRKKKTKRPSRHI